jgi:hypothetical protein
MIIRRKVGGRFCAVAVNFKKFKEKRKREDAFLKS